jgi:antirestriction protein
MSSTFRIWLGDLGAYNEGRLVGEWINLPCDEEALAQLVDRYTRGGQGDCYIADYEAPIRHDSFVHMSPQKLNEVAEEFEGLSQHDLLRVEYLLGEGYDIDKALGDYEDVIFYEGMTLKRVAMELVDEGAFGEIPDSIAGYIDYEAIGRDLGFDGYVETPEGVFYFNK